jgi:glycosyltransferase involved in cell wall biosynthesis
VTRVRVLGFGTYDVRTHPRIGVILAGLRAHGDDVVEANAPLGLSTAARIEMVRRPWLGYRLVLRLARCWARLIVRSLRLRRAGRFDAVVVGYLGQFDVVLARLLFPRTPIVLDQLVFGADTAADRGLSRAGGLRQRALRTLDEVATAAADLVVVDTIENSTLLRSGHQAKAVVAPVGAGEEWFAAGRARTDDQPGAPLRVVFFGLFTPLQGAEVVARALATLSDRDDIMVTMIGSGQDHQRARELAAPNARVHWVDWVDAGELPAMVAAHDVCLGIFGTAPKALRVVPNKVFQGAAAGCAIVTSDTAPQRRDFGGASVLVPPGDPLALATALRQLADDRDEVARLGAAAHERAAADFAPPAIVEALRARVLAG